MKAIFQGPSRREQKRRMRQDYRASIHKFLSPGRLRKLRVRNMASGHMPKPGVFLTTGACIDNNCGLCHGVGSRKVNG